MYLGGLDRKSVPDPIMEDQISPMFGFVAKNLSKYPPVSGAGDAGTRPCQNLI